MASRVVSFEALLEELDWPSLALPSAVGVGLLGLAYVAERGFVSELLHDLSIACFVSVFVTIFIEYLGHRRREIAAESGMLELVGGALVPKLALEEFVQNILSSGVVCTSWALEIAISSECESDRLLCCSTLTYTLTNYTSRDQSVPLKHELEGVRRGRDGSGRPVPRFEELMWNATAPDFVADGRMNSDEMEVLRQQPHPDWLEHSIQIPANGRTTATLKRVEFIPFPGQMPWFMFWTTIRPRVNLRPDAGTKARAAFSVVLRHPMGRELRMTDEGVWEIPTAVFPGQGFAIEACINRHQPSQADSRIRLGAD